ncbi:hypothetical protein FH972_026595 [Carpinus fangiana]|uniref:Cytosolic Fe-S cluster assembly factor NBP35 n=1 Tax=Carpinus fangiana TaxID=176857 RepID=A0A5N6L4G6_9ROSI|nr:hypothetical protein FH972_026595 [Carpinus fangiana]
MPNVQGPADQGRQRSNPNRLGCVAANLSLSQCDGTKPVCTNCTKSRRICIEINATKEPLVIHVENTYASGALKRPRGPRSTVIVPQPQIDLLTKARAYYMQYHLQTPADVPKILRGLADSIIQWKTSGNYCRMVDLAISTMSLAVFAQTQRHPKAALEASSNYGDLLRLAHISLPGLVIRSVDCCLLAISLMCRYEGAMHGSEDVSTRKALLSLKSWGHYDGAMVILKICDFGEDGHELEYDGVVVRTINLHHTVANLKSTLLQSNLQIKSLAMEAIDLDEALQAWAAQIAAPWSSRCQHMLLAKHGPWPTQHFYSSTVYSYRTAGNASAWSQYFALRMLLNSICLATLDQSTIGSETCHTLEMHRMQCDTRLRAMSDGLAASIPFSLERFKVDEDNTVTLDRSESIKPYLASMAVWPLTIASTISRIDATQQQWFKSELGALGRITGDGVLTHANNGPPAAPNPSTMSPSAAPPLTPPHSDDDGAVDFNAPLKKAPTLVAPEPEHCPGPESERAGQADSCAGCPNQAICASAPKGPDPDIPLIAERLSGVKHKLLVLSGKGGVGKSTFTTMLAYAFAEVELPRSAADVAAFPEGGRTRRADVGIMDADICGPSIPTMLGVEGEQLHVSASGWSPVYAADNLAVMSIQFMLPARDAAVIWRGPKKNGLLKQFLKDVEWGALDYMVVDTPPGTTDEHLSVNSFLGAAGVDGALLVTTPQEVALLDVRKELDFCKKAGIRVLGLVENMSGFVCGNCQHTSQVFRATTGGAKRLAEETGVPYLGAVPLDPRIALACDWGESFMDAYPTSPACEALRGVVRRVREEIGDASLDA